MQVQRKDFHGFWKQKLKGTSRFQKFMSAVYGTKQTYLKGTVDTPLIRKAWQVKNQLLEPPTSRSFCRHINLERCSKAIQQCKVNSCVSSAISQLGGPIFQWIQVILCQFFCRETSCFPISWIKGSCKCSLQSKDFLYQRQEHMTNSDKPLVCEQLSIQGNTFVVCLCSNIRCKGSTMSYGKTEDLWRKSTLEKQHSMANIWTVFNCQTHMNTVALVVKAFLSIAPFHAHHMRPRLTWPEQVPEKCNRFLSPSNLKPPDIRQRPCRASALCLVGPFL